VSATAAAAAITFSFSLSGLFSRDYYAPTPRVGALSDDGRLTFVCLTTSVTYTGPKSRTERSRKTKMAQREPTSHITQTPLSRSQKVKGQLAGSRGILWRPPAQLVPSQTGYA